MKNYNLKNKLKKILLIVKILILIIKLEHNGFLLCLFISLNIVLTYVYIIFLHF